MNKKQTENFVRLCNNAAALGLDLDQVNALRRAEITLHRWAELECGDGNDYASWSIERDETTSKPYMVTYPHTGETHRRAIADREAGALRRIAGICKGAGLYYHHQTDPRGCQLYISRNKMDGSNYTQGLAICI